MNTDPDIQHPDTAAATGDDSVRRARRVTWLGFWVNAALGVAKIAGGLIGRSSALVADGIHSFSDFLSDIIVLVFVGIARKRPDAGHQFGHGHYEAFATILLSVVLALVAVGIFYESTVSILHVIDGGTLPRPGIIVLVILLASIVSKEWLYHVTRRVGQSIHSDAVIANAWHHRSDSFSSIATLVGVAGAIFLGEQWRVLDPVAAMVVAVFITWVAIQLARPALAELLGASLPHADIHIINETLRHTDGIRAWHGIRTFKSGRDAYIEVHLLVDPDITVRRAHEIATLAERRIAHGLPDTHTHVITHIEPFDPHHHTKPMI